MKQHGLPRCISSTFAHSEVNLALEGLFSAKECLAGGPSETMRTSAVDQSFASLTSSEYEGIDTDGTTWYGLLCTSPYFATIPDGIRRLSFVKNNEPHPLGNSLCCHSSYHQHKRPSVCICFDFCPSIPGNNRILFSSNCSRSSAQCLPVGYVA